MAVVATFRSHKNPKNAKINNPIRKVPKYDKYHVKKNWTNLISRFSVILFFVRSSGTIFFAESPKKMRFFGKKSGNFWQTVPNICKSIKTT